MEEFLNPPPPPEVEAALFQRARPMLAYYQAVAEHRGLPFVNLLESPPDAALLSPHHLRDYLAFHALPWRREDGSITIAASRPDEWTQRWARASYGSGARIAMTSPYDIRRTIEQHFRPALCEQSRLSLYRITPALSARHTFTPAQRVALIGTAAALLAAAMLAPQPAACAFVLAMHGVYALNMTFKALLFHSGRRSLPAPPALANDNGDLPVYSILVPLYREVASLPRLIAALSQLDYPPHRLDIKLVLEEDDRETYGALMALRPDRRFDIIRVPASHPRTKPKALNYALRFARGEFVTVYDAEDVPHPRQLRAAVAAFRAAPDDVVCMQARLNYYNADASLLSRWFAFEYAILFNALLPGLAARRLPIPLGGTSNHLALDKLRALGEWDPFNVTEDADLGTRLAARGFRTRMLPSLTLEEAPTRLMPWLRQRSRWIKGYLQTWFVHMRAPGELRRALGWRGFLGFQCFVGLPAIVFLTAPPMWAITALSLAHPSLLERLALPGWFAWLAALNLAFHFGLHWWQAWRLRDIPPAIRPWRRRIALVSFPLYWLLHSLASYRALWQLAFRPHFWEKTDHGQLTAPQTAAIFRAPVTEKRR